MADHNATLSAVLDKTAGLVDNVTPAQYGDPTPCTDWNVERLVQHLSGWTDAYAERAEGKPPAEDPDAVTVGPDTAAGFRAAAARVMAVKNGSEPEPEKSPSTEILIAEYILHGWDLAKGTDQPVPYSDAEAAPGLEAMLGMLKPEYRGMGFEAEVNVPEDAGELTRLIAFSGRTP